MIAVHDGTRRLEATTPLLRGASQDFPVVPTVPEEAK